MNSDDRTVEEKAMERYNTEVDSIREQEYPMLRGTEFQSCPSTMLM